MPCFMKAFHERHFLFLGYGLRDWNLRLVLRNLRESCLTFPGTSAPVQLANGQGPIVSKAALLLMRLSSDRPIWKWSCGRDATLRFSMSISMNSFADFGSSRRFCDALAATDPDSVSL